jgi:DNA polymerase III epsilon subunit family exonuclease
MGVTPGRSLRLPEARFLVIDTETTGVDVTQDRVVELGAVYFEAGRRGEVRRMRINPERPIPKEASEIHGIYDEHVRHKPTFAQIAARFCAHVDGSALGGAPPWLVGYNATGFDVPLINAELVRAGLAPAIDAAEVLDLMLFVRWHHRHLRSRSLTSICQHYGIPLSQAHSAAADAEATGRLLLLLCAEGLVPESIDEALIEQARLRRRLEDEWGRYSYWLYHDRRDGYLRMGAGRHCGEPLDEMEPDYLLSLLERIPDLPAPVREIFTQRIPC